MAQCPNCARTVRFWHNYSGYCSKQCRTESISGCPNCGKVGLFKHVRLGCCSEECRCWYVASLLGYDKEALLTPAWEKVVYHVRLPSTSAEISSLQLDELEYDRAVDTVLVIAAPPWMSRSKVLAELPYDRFDNAAWQHLWADGTLTEDELFRFHRDCYEDDVLCQKLGEHVYAKLRQPVMPYGPFTPLPALMEPATHSLSPSRQPTLPQARIAGPALPPHDFVNSVRALFEDRGYSVTPGAAENSFLLRRAGRTAVASYHFRSGMVDADLVQRGYAAAVAADAAQTFVVTNGHFTLQAEDFASGHPIQLIDGDELASLAARRREMPTVVAHGDTADATRILDTVSPGTGISLNGDRNAEHAELASGSDPPKAAGNISVAGSMAPLDAEFVDDGGAMEGAH